MTNPDYRALCAELVKAWDATADFDFNDFGHAAADIVTRARAALAQTEPVAPTDEELLELMPQQFQDDLATVSRLAAHGTSPDVTPGIFRVSLNTGALDFARAVLARWGSSTNNTSEEITQ